VKQKGELWRAYIHPAHTCSTLRLVAAQIQVEETQPDANEKKSKAKHAKLNQINDHHLTGIMLIK